MSVSAKVGLLSACVMAIWVSGCESRESGSGGPGQITTAKSESLRVGGPGAACQRMCRHVSDCQTRRQGEDPARVRRSEIYASMVGECMLGCVGKMPPAEVKCWTRASCTKAGKLGALTGRCLAPPVAKAPPKRPPAKAPPKAPEGPTCDAMCAHVLSCPSAKTRGATAGETAAECQYRCEKLSGKVRACYAEAPCVDVPLVSALTETGCVGLATRRCVDSQECLKEGECTWRNARSCRATKASIEGSLRCTERGLCSKSKRNGSFEPRSTRDCQRSDHCKEHGTCKKAKLRPHNRHARCVPTNAGCARTDRCREQGLCVAAKKWWYCAASRGGCARSEACREKGWCGAKMTTTFVRDLNYLRCVTTDSGCRRSEACRRRGECWARPDRRTPGACVSRGIEDCRQICRGLSDCTFVYDRGCVARSENACRAKHGGGKGTWTFENGRCVPQSDADCEADIGCTWGQGRCSRVDGKCALAKDADCARVFTENPKKQKVMSCAAHGLCTFEGGKCVLSDAGCRKSSMCREEGRCTERRGACVATSNEDCAQSQLCARNGACIAVEERCSFRCGQGPKARQCAQ